MCRLSARHRVTVGLISVTCNVSQAVYVHNNELSAVKGMSNRGFQSILLRVRRVLACHRATSPNQAVLDVIPFLPAFLLQVLRATTTYSVQYCTLYFILRPVSAFQHLPSPCYCRFLLFYPAWLPSPTIFNFDYLHVVAFKRRRLAHLPRSFAPLI